MDAKTIPKPYHEWRLKPVDRAEDAAYTFGCHLIGHCRSEALKKLESGTAPKNADEFREQVTAAVDAALHNVMDLLEGYWRTKSGQDHRVE